MMFLTNANFLYFSNNNLIICAFIGIKNTKNLNLIKGLYLGGKSKYEKTKKLLKI